VFNHVRGPGCGSFPHAFSIQYHGAEPGVHSPPTLEIIRQETRTQFHDKDWSMRLVNEAAGSPKEGNIGSENVLHLLLLPASTRAF
jgi:hypothetical protein